MIPKIIHYCWFGNGELPVLMQKCIDSWKVYLPDFEIREWNEENFDVNQYQFAAEAYKERKFAFVSDVCRLHALREMGGIYLDTDVEFLKPLDDALLADIAFTGFEDNLLLSSAIMGSEKNGKWINDLLSHYENRSFYHLDGSFDMKPNTEIITTFMKEQNGLLVNNHLQKIEACCTVYPSEYFCPKSWQTLQVSITPKTYCIHHFAGSWIHEEKTFVGKLANFLLGRKIANTLSAVYRKMKK